MRRSKAGDQFLPGVAAPQGDEGWVTLQNPSVPGTAFTYVALYWESRRAVKTRPNCKCHCFFETAWCSDRNFGRQAGTGEGSPAPGAEGVNGTPRFDACIAWRFPVRMSAAGQKRRSCFEKKALPILTVVTLSREPYSQRRTNPLCRELTSRRRRIERSISITPVLRARGSRDCNSNAEKSSTSSVIINLTRTENQSLQF
jgi:hypothetical protein